jgi:hypothetical protein
MPPSIPSPNDFPSPPRAPALYWAESRSPACRRPYLARTISRRRPAHLRCRGPNRGEGKSKPGRRLRVGESEGRGGRLNRREGMRKPGRRLRGPPESRAVVGEVVSVASIDAVVELSQRLQWRQTCTSRCGRSR